MKKIIIYLVLLCFGIISCDKGNIIPEDTNQSTEINTNEPETDKDDPSGNGNDEVDNNENEGVDEGEGNEEDDFIGGGAEYYHSNSYIASFYKPISIKLLKYLGVLFPVMMVTMASLLLPAWLEVSALSSLQFTAFIAAAGIIFTGSAPAFKNNDLEKRVHTASALVAAVFALLWTKII